MNVRRRSDHSLGNLLKRTISAQLHILGCIFMTLGGAALLPLAQKAGPSHFVACASFVTTGFLVFSVSSIYHFLSDGYDISHRLQTFLENFDHFSIYLFIAGTYSPFLLGAVSSAWRLPLLAGIWSIAFVGIMYTWSKPMLPVLFQSRGVYTGIFVLMGCSIVIRLNEVVSAISWAKLLLLVGGGAAYTLGAVVYAIRRPDPFPGFFGYHELWHLMVLLGAGLHYFLILSFYL